MNDLTDNDRPLRGRRLTWREFEQLTGRPRPVYVAANDNEKPLGAPSVLNAGASETGIFLWSDN